MNKILSLTRASIVEIWSYLRSISLRSKDHIKLKFNELINSLSLIGIPVSVSCFFLAILISIYTPILSLILSCSGIMHFVDIQDKTIQALVGFSLGTLLVLSMMTIAEINILFITAALIKLSEFIIVDYQMRVGNV